MWVIKNNITGAFLEKVNNDTTVTTTDSKVYAAHFSSWSVAAAPATQLKSNWKPVPKDEA